MLMRDQHLYKSPAIEVCGHFTDSYYPDWEYLVNFFFNTGLKHCWHGQLGIEPTTLDLSSQSGAHDLSAKVVFQHQITNKINKVPSVRVIVICSDNEHN